MIKQNIIIYAIPILYKVLKELETELDYNIIYVSNKKNLLDKNLSNYVILCNQKNLNFDNSIELLFPIKIWKLKELINIQFMKFKTKEKSSVIIGSYNLDLNSRTLEYNSNSISLTEKEVNLIMFLNTSSESVDIQKLQIKVWGYKNKLDSHTVETHIHRLRKKISLNFKSDRFILSDKKGYYLNKLSDNI